MKKKVIVFGSSGDTGKSVINIFKKRKWDVISFSRKNTKDRKNIKLNFDNKIEFENKISQVFKKNKNINTVINCIGFWQSTDDNYWNKAMIKTNLELADNIIRSTLKFINKKKPTRFITISSLDSIYLNTNAFEYSVAKSGLRTLCKLYQKKFRKTKINFDLITPGAIHSRQRSHKKEKKNELVQCKQIAELCYLIAETNYNLTYEEILLRPKRFEYQL